jgi:5'-3' exonuclease
MGIPSYYKTLCDRVPGLLAKVRKGQQPTHLWIDFNCMVYHCLRRPGATAYPGEAGRVAWEDKLIRDVCAYVRKVVSLVGPTQQVFLGVDGVVPMAKLRQQRLRRFKSPWTAAEEVRIGKREAGAERWDTNAITPGTAFMERLGAALKQLSGSGPLKWIVSDASEPGEGEHKAMTQIRACAAKESHVIYGLDADLIVLSLLQPVKELWLFREAVECGEVKYTDSEEEYRYFSIHKLREVLCNGDLDLLRDYCMAMSFLGNDFLPHSFTFKLKDGGHNTLMDMLKEVRREGSLTTEKGWTDAGIQRCLQWLAKHEEGWMERHCLGKLGKRYQHTRGSSPVEHAVDEWNKMPLRAADELSLVVKYTKETCILKDNWREVYWDRYMGGGTTGDRARACEEYLRGLDWIFKYYMGQPVDREWCFHWYTTPLWADLAAAAVAGEPYPKASAPSDWQLAPQQQLALVLPLESYNLIRDSKLRRLPRLAPQLWPSQFGLFTGGRGQTWECEALLPLFTMSRLRTYLAA